MEFAPERYTDPKGFLAGIRADGFAVSVIDHMNGVRPAPDAMVAGGEHMLLLRR